MLALPPCVIYNPIMLLLITKKIAPEELKKISEDFDGYIKIVADLERGILTGGGKRHVEGEQRLLSEGSKQENLWGGGLDLKSREIDYNSIINIRPSQGNPSRDIMSDELRKKFNKIVQELLL